LFFILCLVPTFNFKMNDAKKDWLYGDSKKDRQGRLIYFIGYSEDTNSKGDSIELWEPEDIFLNRDQTN